MLFIYSFGYQICIHYLSIYNIKILCVYNVRKYFLYGGNKSNVRFYKVNFIFFSLLLSPFRVDGNLSKYVKHVNVAFHINNVIMKKSTQLYQR